jgi:hypothetical protein
MILMRPTEELNTLYYGYVLKAYQATIESYAEGSTGQTEINKNRLLKETMVAYPVDKNEQYKIAKILADLDEKILVNERINNNFTPSTSRAKPRRHRPLGARSQMDVWRCGFIGRQPDSEQLCCERGAAA